MALRSKKPRDINAPARVLVDEATSEVEPERPAKNPAAVALGRLGGLKGGPARKKKLSAKRRSEIARNAAQTRWHS